jgi:hypothetical protein
MKSPSTASARARSGRTAKPRFFINGLAARPLLVGHRSRQAYPSGSGAPSRLALDGARAACPRERLLLIIIPTVTANRTQNDLLTSLPAGQIHSWFR